MYGEPLVSPVTVVLVGAGEPLTVLVDWATPLRYGVITYDVTGPPVVGAVQLSWADAFPATALTFEAGPGAAAAENCTSTQ